MGAPDEGDGVMLVIRQEQLKAFRSVSLRQFIDEAVDYLGLGSGTGPLLAIWASRKVA